MRSTPHLPKRYLEIKAYAVDVRWCGVVTDVRDVEIGSRAEPPRYAKKKFVVVDAICMKVIKGFFGEKRRKHDLAVMLQRKTHLETISIDTDVVSSAPDTVFIEVAIAK